MKNVMQEKLLAMMLVAMTALPVLAADKKYGPGVSDSEILLGQTMPYSGPASFFSQVGKAEAAYLDKINAAGGVNGRKIRLLSLDDSYAPPKTVEQTRKLVEGDGVLAIFGSVGTATNLATYRYLNQQKVPQLFIMSGLERWNSPKESPWTTAWIPSYFTEGRVYGQYVLREVPNPKIAILTQNDDGGKEFVRGLRSGLGEKGNGMIVAEATYEPTDPTVDSQIVTLAGSGATVFYNAGNAKSTAQAIRKAYDIGWKPLQIIVSPAASVGGVLRPAGLEKSVGIVSAAFVKDPTDKSWSNDPGYKEWLDWMKKYLPNGSTTDYFNVVGYSAAMTMVEVLRRCGDDLTRENVLRQAQSFKGFVLPMLLPGIALNSSPTDYTVIKQMQLQRFDGAEWVLFGPIY